MENVKVEIHITRLHSYFTIDGTSWRIPADGLDGFGELSSNVSSTDGGSYSGGMLTGVHIGLTQRTITFEGAATSAARDELENFFSIGEDCTVYTRYKGRQRYFSGTISALKINAGNVYRSTSVTMTFDCDDPYFYSGWATFVKYAEVGASYVEADLAGSGGEQGQYPTPLYIVAKHVVKAAGTDTVTVGITRNKYGGVLGVPTDTTVVFQKNVTASSSDQGVDCRWDRFGSLSYSEYPPLWTSTALKNVSCGLLVPRDTTIKASFTTVATTKYEAYLMLQWLPRYGGI